MLQRLLLCAACALGLPAFAAPLAVGDAIPPIIAKDQYGVSYTFTNGTALLIIAVEMEVAKSANQKLAEQGTGFLEKHDAVYLMDIHTMPDIGRFFALRKMRKYPQRIVLVDSAETLAQAPAKPGHATLLKLTPAGRISAIQFWNPASQLATELFKLD